MSTKEIPAKMMALKLKEKTTLYNCYMPFFEHGGLFVPTDDVFSLGEDILLAVEIGEHPKLYLPTKVAWINPARTSANRPKGIGLAFSSHENCLQTKSIIEGELGNALRSDRATFTL
ncbi:pilus assembly protein [Neisseria sp. N95_16]|uniref:Pilus assembly protein n=1 Tax=Neisseria brasiliensis TaxID=2666100 RepID=A0A5Q3RVE3_9NEIS|nr:MULTISPECIES: PilZ domain-containing protein [Neisseria]MRN38826.1 pilus assembly protein [Neisseria brasiliensis]PJO09424.1 pilus assembly protein [Neisseria sp. N95_16]PJO78517.1 pilus assembly protein [Neisseria sp. N177_16]QGL24307.1 pilus assembly protein [Neisseria brasiliensis]